MLSTTQVFVLKTLFLELKHVLPDHPNTMPQILQLVMANKVAIERPHWVEDFRLKGEDLWGWSFHLSLCQKGTCLSLFSKATRKISHVTVPFGCVLLTRSDVTKVGWGGKAGNMMLQGHFFYQPMARNWKNLKEYSVTQDEWEALENQCEQNTYQLSALLDDKEVQLKIDSVVRVLQKRYPFPDDFLALMKTK